jgi:hypothetical protein
MWTYIPRVVSNRAWASREFQDCSSIQKVLQELTSRANQYTLVFSGQVVVKCQTDSFEEFTNLGKMPRGEDKYKLLLTKNKFVYDKLAYISYDHTQELEEILNCFNMDESIVKKVVIYNKGSFMR